MTTANGTSTPGGTGSSPSVVGVAASARIGGATTSTAATTIDTRRMTGGVSVGLKTMGKVVGVVRSLGLSEDWIPGQKEDDGGKGEESGTEKGRGKEVGGRPNIGLSLQALLVFHTRAWHL